MSQDYVRVLEAAGLTDAARIIAAMDAGKEEPAKAPEPVESTPPAPQYATQAEADGAAMLEAMRAAGMLDNYTPIGKEDAR